MGGVPGPRITKHKSGIRWEGPLARWNLLTWEGVRDAVGQRARALAWSDGYAAYSIDEHDAEPDAERDAEDDAGRRGTPMPRLPTRLPKRSRVISFSISIASASVMMMTGLDGQRVATIATVTMIEKVAEAAARPGRHGSRRERGAKR